MNRYKVRFNVLAIVLLFALLFASAVSAAPKDGPTVKLGVTQGEFASGQDVLVTVTIQNTTNHTVRILKWFTPVYGVEESLFGVMRNGEPVAYTGPIYKRPAATGNDYLSLKAGESITSVVNLDNYYDLSASGQYEVFYAVASYNLFTEKTSAFKFREVLISEKISFKADGRAGKRPTPTPTPPPGGISYSRCTDEQVNLLVPAHAEAKNYSTGAKGYLSGINSGTPRYTTWFGVFDPGRYNTVKTNFTAIEDAFYNKAVTYDCGCKQNYYAYVYPTQPYKIYVCKAFWQAPLTGTDSKAGTLIHEMSHFNVVASTDDFVYGQLGAKQLAIDSPNNAVNNADNHEYFAENTPPLD